MPTSKEIGLLSEKSVCEFLKGLGYIILDMNYYSRYGELDIVAKDENYTVFIEVKSRKNKNFALPCQSVTMSKQRKLILTAQTYIVNRHPDTFFRFDVVEVIHKIENNEYIVKEFNHIKNAFGVDGHGIQNF